MSHQISAWKWNANIHRNPKIMDQCLVQRFLSLLPNDKKKEYTDQCISHLNKSYLDSLRWFVSKFCMTFKPERKENKARMQAGWGIQDEWATL